MKSDIKSAKPITFTERVEDWMRPYIKDVVDHPVFSTWAMTRAFENTSGMLLEKYLDKGEEAVGYEVNVRHIAAAPLGADIKIVAKIKKVKSPLVITSLEAYCKDKKIGEGTHAQYVMKKDSYKNYIARSKNGTRDRKK
ncbi:thioesterase family protein [Elusimicrobiota bacterium]